MYVFTSVSIIAASVSVSMIALATLIVEASTSDRVVMEAAASAIARSVPSCREIILLGQVCIHFMEDGTNEYLVCFTQSESSSI